MKLSRAFVLFVVVTVVGCSDVSDVPNAIPAESSSLLPDLVFPEEFQVGAAPDFEKRLNLLPDSAKEVVDRVERAEPIPYDLLTRAVFDIHYSRSNRPNRLSWTEFARFLLDARLEEKLGNPGEFMSVLENSIKRRGRFSEIFYEPTHTNLLDYFEGYMESYSGTMMFLVARRMLAAKHPEKNWDALVLFTSGHVHPAWVVGLYETDMYQLDMTLGGNPVLHVAKKDSYKALRARVYFESDFLLYEVLRYVSSENELLQFRDRALLRAAIRYGLPLKETEGNIRCENNAEDDRRTLGSGILGFGKHPLTPGKVSRAYHVMVPKVWDKERYLPFFRAIAEHDAAKIETMLREGFDPNISGGDNLKTVLREYANIDISTPLHAAISNKDLKILRLLLAFGADPLARGTSNHGDLFRPAIFEAISLKAYQSLKVMAEVLCKNGRLDSQVARFGDSGRIPYSALAFAVEKRDQRAIDALINMGADPDRVLDVDHYHTVRSLDQWLGGGKPSGMLPSSKK